MKSNYERLGDYIEPCNEFNDNMQVKELLGISNQKYFQKSHTNTIGIDLTKYRIVRNNQFAFNRATTRNGEKISIALRQGNDCMVSPSYRIFKSKDENKLNSQYLMMWFRRPEFDRYARFKSHGSAHEFFDMDEMKDVELPIPSPEKQQQLVKEYHTLQKRIDLNNKMIAKLEETAQTIYKQWFVEFEFPDENGKPYKSNGGKMVWCAEFEKEIPGGWENRKLYDFITIKNGKSRPTSEGLIPVYGGNGIIDYAIDYNYENLNIIGRVGAYCGSVFYDEGRVWVSDNALAGISKNNTLYFDFLTLSNLNLNSKSEGSSHPLLTQGILNNISIIKSINNNIYIEFEEIVKPFFYQLNNLRKLNQKLEELKDLLLGKMAKGD
jgi:type I restriction enzyme S subunit